VLSNNPVQEEPMNTTQVRTDDTTVGTNPGRIDLKLEAVVIPVTDVDRAKTFYSSLDWRLDADFAFDNGFRIVQFTPPGSPASVQFGSNVTTAPAGSARGLYLVVSDIEAARDQLAARGVEVSPVFHPGAPGGQFQADGASRLGGADGDRSSYGSFATFADPDGNSWLLQEVTTRLPGRIDTGQTTYASVNDLMQALIRVATAHGEHEKRNGGEYDEQWPAWYAAYLVAEQNGQELPV
jgi:predicted enzyme related to lactoylglutathione lyase